MNDFEIDKARFGQFLAEERKRKGFTQKELAGRLFVSDKAVSKWERGLSLPDVSLLIPLGKELGVTVTELLEGRRLETSSGMGMEKVEHLVKQALSLSAETPEPERRGWGKRLALWVSCALIALGEYGILLAIDRRFPLAHFHQGASPTIELLLAVFSAWFWLGARERLPAYYDENPISFYSDGIFQLHLAGIRFNNRNWPHILRGVRVSTLAALVAVPAVYTLVELLLGAQAGHLVMLALFLGGLFVPVYYLGRKYQ